MTPKQTCPNLEELKQEYETFRQKHELPDFTELNKHFDIEEIDTETEFLLRKIRRNILEKIAGYLRFVEIILNPSNAPMFFFKLIKKLDSDDRTTLTKIYENLSSFEIKAINLDLDYNEQKEAEFIKNIQNNFKTFKKELLEVIKKLDNGEGVKTKNNNGSYFG